MCGHARSKALRADLGFKAGRQNLSATILHKPTKPRVQMILDAGIAVVAYELGIADQSLFNHSVGNIGSGVTSTITKRRMFQHEDKRQCIQIFPT